MSDRISAAQLQPFIDWVKSDPTHSLSGAFGRGEFRSFNQDAYGPLEYYDPQWKASRTISQGLRLIPADFIGTFTASDGRYHVIVALALEDPKSGSPISMAFQYVGGPFNGFSLQSNNVLYDFGWALPDVAMYILDGSHEYNLQIVKEPIPRPTPEP
jgi:hypothetical protein